VQHVLVLDTNIAFSVIKLLQEIVNEMMTCYLFLIIVIVPVFEMTLPDGVVSFKNHK
jgi:hypothetical protein